MIFKNPCANKKILWAIPAILVVISLISIVFRGFNSGIDFTSGTTFEFTLPEGYSYSSDMEEEVKSMINETVGDGASTQVQKTTSNNLDGMFIKTTELDAEQQTKVIVALLTYFGNEDAVLELETEAASADNAESLEAVTEEASELSEDATAAEEAVEEATEEAAEEEEATEEGTALAEAAESDTEEGTAEEATEAAEPMLTRSMIKTDQVSASASATLIGDTFKAVVLALILMLIYISIRFDFKSGACALIALAHDVTLMFGFYSIFHLTMNTSFVAAVLTIIGYSINATIIVFDRVRENIKSMKKTSFDEKANEAIMKSYPRTLFSSLTTLFTIGALFVLGVSSIREFALPIIVGLVCGAYSSLFIAPTIWAAWKESGSKGNPAKKSK